MILYVFLEGVDTWTRLYARMVVMLPKLNPTATACKKNMRIFSKHTRMINWQMEFLEMLVMRASFIRLLISSGTKPNK